jgi:hypothetical protein
MFLAAIYPLSERSAVNLMGKVNTGNLTGFEEESIFESSNQAIEIVEEQEDEDQMDIVPKEEDHSQPSKKIKTENGKGVRTKDYSLYRTFWNIQVPISLFFPL